MRASLNPDDMAYARTKWILSSGARIIVKLDGAQVANVVTADEATGVVTVESMPGIFGLRKGKVEINVSLRD